MKISQSDNYVHSKVCVNLFSGDKAPLLLELSFSVSDDSPDPTSPERANIAKRCASEL